MEKKKKFWTYMMILETDKPEKVEQAINGLIGKETVKFYRADSHNTKQQALDYIIKGMQSKA